MGQDITFARPDGGEAGGYLAECGNGSAPGVVLIQEWWGLNDQICGVADRFARAGYNALAPDLYEGRVTQEPDEANHMMSGLDFPGATHQDIRGAALHLQDLAPNGDGKVAVMGFCMGGQVSYLIAGHNPDLSVAVCFYPGFVFNRLGSGEDQAPFDTSANIKCPTLILTGEDDGNPSPEMADRMDAALTAAGTVHEMVLYPGAAHAFMSKGGDSYREHPATDGWRRALEWIDRYL